MALVVVLAALEAYLAVRYAALGALFHYWLHGLTGAAAGLSLVPLDRLVRAAARRRLGVLAAALAGRLVFAFPDILFLAANVPHELWMDVFGGHISVHFVPAPLTLAYTVFALAVVAAGLTVTGRRRFAGAAAASVVLLLSAGFTLRAPLPRTLDDVRQHPGLALRCVLPPEPPRLAAGRGTDDGERRSSGAQNNGAGALGAPAPFVLRLEVS